MALTCAGDPLPLYYYQSLMGRRVCRVRPGQSHLYNCGFVMVSGAPVITSLHRGVCLLLSRKSAEMREDLGAKGVIVEVVLPVEVDEVEKEIERKRD